jgi:hypothetical protein
MAGNEALTVHPIAGFDFRVVPNGVAVTVRYYVKGDNAPPNEAQPSYVMQSLTIGLTAAQAKDTASSLERAAQLIESGPGQSDREPGHLN